MLDTKMNALVAETKKKLASMKNARPSEIMAVKESFGEKLLAILENNPLGDITIEQKVAAFDALAKNHVDELIEQVNSLIEGTYCDDDDTDHYTWEAVRTSVLGPKAFDATNAFDKLLSSNSRDD